MAAWTPGTEPAWSFGRTGTPILEESRGGVPEAALLGAGAHVCALYSGPDERDRVLVPFLQEGVRHGDECVSLVDDLEPSGRRRRALGPAVADDVHRGGSVGVHPMSDVCPLPGELSVPRLTTLLATTWASTGEDPSLLRVAAEMAWVRRTRGTDVLAYESAVEEVLAVRPAVFLCLFDLRTSGAELIAAVLRVHSTVLMDGTVLHNRHRLAPGDCPGATPGAGARYPLAARPCAGVEGGGQWLTLTGAEVRVAELVADGLTNRAVAEVLVVSPHTVDAHLKHIYLKLGIHSRVELTVLVLRIGDAST